MITITLIIILIKYNNMKIKTNKIYQSKYSVDVYLKERADLIPNLLNCVKAVSQHEFEVLNSIVLERQIDKNVFFDSEIVKKEIKIIKENYPSIKTSDNYMKLQENLVTIENYIQASRRFYISAVTDYNIYREKFPNNLVAKLFKFKKQDFPSYISDINIDVQI